MLQKVYSVRDAKGECFRQPFFKITHGEAERDFAQLVKDPKTIVAQYPQDFELWYLGDYDEKKGLLIPLATPQHVVSAIMLLDPQDRPVVQPKPNLDLLNGSGKVTNQ